MTDYPELNGLAKAYSLAVYVHDAPKVGPRPPYEIALRLDTDRLTRVIVDGSEHNCRDLQRFQLDEFGRLRMRRDHGDHGVWLEAVLDADENADEVYTKIRAALEPHGWTVP